MFIIISLSTLLILSISLNVFLAWFAWKSISQIAEYDDELKDLVRVFKNFSQHLQSVHDLEMFYGDETLRHLMRHATDIIDTFEVYDLMLSDEEEYDTAYEET